MKIAVTGSSGALGRIIVARLAVDPAVDSVVALDRAEPRALPGRVQFVNADVRDPDLERHLRGVDAVLHLAYIVEKGSRDPVLTEAVNVGGTMNVFAAAAAAGVRQVVYASSIAAYGFHPANLERPRVEDDPTPGNEDFYYPRHKGMCERWLDEFEPQHPEMIIARLRPSIFVGPRGRGVDLFRKAVFPYFTGPDQPTHVTHEDDVVAAFLLVLRRQVRGAFNVATDQPLPARQFAAQMGKPALPIPGPAIGVVADWAYRTGRIDIDPQWLRSGRSYPITVSSNKLRSLGWRPTYPTTGAALRALAGRPTAAASRRTRALLGGLGLVTRLLPQQGLGGAANMYLTGARPSEWRLAVAGGRVRLHPGADAEAEAAVTLSEEVFFELLAGRISWERARASGSLRLSGEASVLAGVGWALGLPAVRLVGRYM